MSGQLQMIDADIVTAQLANSFMALVVEYYVL